MKIKVLVAAVVVASIATPALAATYYVVQTSKTPQKCSVATTKPSATSKTRTLVADTAGYKTKKDATAAMTAAAECKAAT
jgi:opacity protein-like surface antigen